MRKDRFPQAYHLAWLSAHPDRDIEWLRQRTADNFHVHHVDGDHSNDDPANLILIEGGDHMRLHGMKLPNGISAWRARRKRAPRPATVYPSAPVLEPADIAALRSRIG